MGQRNHSCFIISMITVGAFLNETSSYAGARVLTHDQDVRVPDQYIVILKNEVTAEAIDSVITRNLSPSKVDFIYKYIFRGFSANLNEDELTKLTNDPAVDYIEEDAKV